MGRKKKKINYVQSAWVTTVPDLLLFYEHIKDTNKDLLTKAVDIV